MFLFFYIFYRILFFFFLMIRRPPRSTLFPYTTLFRSLMALWEAADNRLKRLFSKNTGECQAAQGAVYSLTPARCRKASRSEEHTSELQSHSDLVCRLLLEKKKKKRKLEHGIKF